MPPPHALNPWGKWQLRLTVREDAGAVVRGEFAPERLGARPTFDTGPWQSNGDGTRTSTFRDFNFGARSGFAQLRA